MYFGIHSAVFVVILQLFHFSTLGECAFLKSKEVIQLQNDVEQIKETIKDLQNKLNIFERQVKEDQSTIKTNLLLCQGSSNIELVESRMTSLELRLLHLEQPISTPGSISRRPAIRRPSAQRVPSLAGSASPNRQEAMDYFTPTSPFS